jgi:hypothetical protein
MLCVIWACVGTVPHTSIINNYVLSSEVTQALVNPLESFEHVELSVKYLSYSRSLLCRLKPQRSDHEANSTICRSSLQPQNSIFTTWKARNYYNLSCSLTFAVLCCILSIRCFPGVWILYADVSAHCLFHRHRACGQVDSFCPHALWRWNRQSVPKRRHIKFRRQGITQKKDYNIITLV